MTKPVSPDDNRPSGKRAGLTIREGAALKTAMNKISARLDTAESKLHQVTDGLSDKQLIDQLIVGILANGGRSIPRLNESVAWMNQILDMRDYLRESAATRDTAGV